MTLFEAILLGGVYWLSSVYLGNLLESFFRFPLCNVLLVGLILGDVPTAMVIGATVMPAYLAFINAGSVAPADQAAAGIIPAACALGYGMNQDVAIALAVPVSLLFAQLWTLNKTLYSFWNRYADRCAEKLDLKGIALAHLLFPALQKIVTMWLPMTLLLYFGGGLMSNAASLLPASVTAGLSVVSKAMPAIGFAMIVKMIGKPSLMPFFFAGYFFVQYTSASTMMATMVAIFIAFLDYRYHSSRGEENEEGLFSMFKKDKSYENANPGLVTRSDINKVYNRWWITAFMSDGYERMKGLCFCYSMLPVLKKVYADRPEELKEALRRHLLFYNTEAAIGGTLIAGIVTSMEEQKAQGGDVPEEAIINVKNSLMGPFAGIGDTINLTNLRPLIFSLFISFGLQGYWWAAVVPVVILVAITQFEGYNLIRIGYRLGTRAASNLLQSGSIQKIIQFFGVLGLFAMGSMSALNVKATLGIMIPTGGTPLNLQTGLLDPILPGLPALVIVWLLYRYLSKGGSMTKGMLMMLGATFVLGFFGILV